MSDTLIATLGGIAAMLGWGSSDWLAARSSKRYGTFETNLAVQSPGLLIMALVLLFYHQTLPSWPVMSQIFLIGLMFTTAYLLMIKAFATGSVGIVAPLTNTFPLTTLILVIAFGNNVFSALQILAMLLIVVGVIFLAYQKNVNNIPLKVLHKETFLALASAVIWGTSFFISDNVIRETSWQVIMATINSTMVFFALLLIAWTARGKVIRSIKNVSKNKQGIASGVILTTGSITFYATAQKTGSVVIPAVIASSSPLLASMLSAIYDKEQLSVLKRIGALIVVSGIIILNIV
ncbi:MAG TPA: DMT family transporter [Candidatus Saccharimonadales bacterium]|nr:DMT family transporter [Candidatus Saccharimonadales bacterium]